MKRINILSKLMALNYIFNEFGNVNLKVTTELDDDGCWTGKIILEQTLEEPKDDLEFANFYMKALCQGIIEKER